MKYFKIQYIARGKKGFKMMKAQTKKDMTNLAKGKVPGVILKIDEVSAPLEDKFKDLMHDISNSIIKKQINPDALIGSLKQLAVMTNAGISIHDSINEIGKAAEDETLREIFLQMNDDLNAGMSLTESATKFKEPLGDITVSMIEMGETTGNMSESLVKLAGILSDTLNNKKQIKKALAYPRNVGIAIVVAFTILMSYVVPKFKAIFEELDFPLPLPTKIMLFCEEMINQHGMKLLIGIVVSVVIIKFILRTQLKAREWKDKKILKVYLIGNLILYGSMSRFTLIFAELVKAGLPMTDALDTATMTIENLELKAKLGNVKFSIEKGENLTESLKKTELFESMLIQMIKAGEEGGSVSEMIANVANYYKQKLQELIDNLSSYVEPIMLAAITAMVLLIALGIFMPMWEMGSAAKN